MIKYFYIIQRNGMTHEVEYTQDGYQSVTQEMAKGGIMVIQKRKGDDPITINAVDVTNILSDVEYENYIETTKPKTWLKDGTWFNKIGEPVKQERWKKLAMEETLRLEAAEEEDVDEHTKARIANKVKEVANSLRVRGVIK